MPELKKAAVVLDSWKYNTFKRVLEGAGYAFTIHPGPVFDQTTLKVETYDLAKLREVVKRANDEARAHYHGRRG